MPTDAVRLTFNEYVMDVLRNRHQRRIIQPDALLELPAQRCRYFLECEMGGHTISPGPSAPPGATLSKAKRYNDYLTRWGDVHAMRTHYALQYADGFRPEVLFLVRSTGRASSINSALAHWREAERTLWQRFADFRALTFDEAAAELRGLVGLPIGNVAAGSKPTTPGAYTVTREELLIVARFFRDSVASIHRGRDGWAAHVRRARRDPRGIGHPAERRLALGEVALKVVHPHHDAAAGRTVTAGETRQAADRRRHYGRSVRAPLPR